MAYFVLSALRKQIHGRTAKIRHKFLEQSDFLDLGFSFETDSLHVISFAKGNIRDSPHQ